MILWEMITNRDLHWAIRFLGGPILWLAFRITCFNIWFIFGLLFVLPMRVFSDHGPSFREWTEWCWTGGFLGN